MPAQVRRELKGVENIDIDRLAEPCHILSVARRPRSPAIAHELPGAGRGRQAVRPPGFVPWRHRYGNRKRWPDIRSPVGDEASMPGHPCPSGTLPCLAAVPVSSQPKIHIAEQTLASRCPGAQGMGVVPELLDNLGDSSRVNHLCAARLDYCDRRARFLVFSFKTKT